MPGTQRRDNMGKVQDNSTPSSTNPVGDYYSGIPLGVTQERDLRGTISDLSREIKEYKEQVTKLRRENKKLKKDLEGDNDKLLKELKGENDKLQKELEGENDKLWKEVETL